MAQAKSFAQDARREGWHEQGIETILDLIGERAARI
jgi:hypothetical protein